MKNLINLYRNRSASIAGVIRCAKCGHEFSDSLGKYGCPNCAE